jgi:hypothetical protein
LKNQDTFGINLIFNDFEGATLVCPKGRLPMLQSVNAIYRYHERMESVQLTAYEGSEGINAFTGISDTWGKQLTMVAKLETDGSRTLSFTTDDPMPLKTAISPRGQKAEPDVAPDRRGKTLASR